MDHPAPSQHLQEQGFDTLAQGVAAQAGELVQLRNNPQQQGMAIVDRLGGSIALPVRLVPAIQWPYGPG